MSFSECLNNIPDTWEIVSLPEVIDFIVDNRGKSVPTEEKGIPLIATNCVKNDSLYPTRDKIRYVTEETYRTWFKSYPLPGDILFVNKGTPGRVCLIPEKIDFCFAQDMVALRANHKIYNRYLFAVLRSTFFQEQVMGHSVGTMIPHCRKTDFEKLVLPLPPYDEQLEIGNMYYMLSEKIELNNQMNKTLEEMAQALFKKWFVDFEFPDEDGEPYKSSGGEMVDSELGMIPRGWGVGYLGDILEIYDSKRKPLSSRQRANMARNYPYYGAASLVDYVEDYLFDGIYVLISEDGANVVDDNGYPLVQYVWDKFWVNNHAHIVKGKNGYSEEHIYILVKNTNMQAIVTGAVQPKINQANLKCVKTIIAQSTIIEKFNHLLTSVFNQYRSNAMENGRLKEMRDILLPKLMSGEIRVTDLQK